MAAFLTQRLLSKPDALLEQKVREWPELWTMVDLLLEVICRRDGNPFALTRLLRIPDIFGACFARNSTTASTALEFLTFGVLQFDNPMFTEDAMQAILTLLRGTSYGPASLLKERCSLPLLEAMATAACYLPSAMTTLELIGTHADGQLCLYSLAEALSAKLDGSGGGAPATAGAEAPPASSAALSLPQVVLAGASAQPAADATTSATPSSSFNSSSTSSIAAHATAVLGSSVTPIARPTPTATSAQEESISAAGGVSGAGASSAVDLSECSACECECGEAHSLCAQFVPAHGGDRRSVAVPSAMGVSAVVDGNVGALGNHPAASDGSNSYGSQVAGLLLPSPSAPLAADAPAAPATGLVSAHSPPPLAAIANLNL